MSEEDAVLTKIQSFNLFAEYIQV